MRRARTSKRSLTARSKPTKRKVVRKTGRTYKFLFEEKLLALHKHSLELASATSVDEVVKHTLDAMEFTLGFDAADFSVVDIDRGCLSFKGLRGTTPSFSELPLGGRGITVKAANARRTIRVPDIRKEDSYIDDEGSVGSEASQMRLSELAVPVVVGRGTAAVLNLESNRLNAFTDNDQKLLETLAFHVASALSRLSKEQEIRKYSEHLEQLVEGRTRALRESETKYRSVVQNIPAMVWTSDQENKTVFITPNVEQVYGYTPREIYQGGYLLWSKRIHPDDVQKLEAAYESLFTEGKVFDVEYRYQRPDGKWFWMHDRANRVYEKAGIKYTDGVTTDITERKRLEEQLAKSQRLATIGELAAMVGHDLRNPLQAIAGAAFNLRSRLGASLDDTTTEILQIIDNGVEYSDRIVELLLDYSRELELHFRKTTPQMLAAQALALVRIPVGIQILSNAKVTPEIIVDEEKMKRVLTNFIQNAVEALPNGGAITISSEVEKDGMVALSVADTGIGISEETKKRIWTPLYTTKAKGIGLGLSICRRIVEAHRGSISVSSEIGKGSMFTLTVPAKPPLKVSQYE